MYTIQYVTCLDGMYKKNKQEKKSFKYEAVVPQTHVGNSLGVIH